MHGNSPRLEDNHAVAAGRHHGFVCNNDSTDISMCAAVLKHAVKHQLGEKKKQAPNNKDQKTQPRAQNQTRTCQQE